MTTHVDEDIGPALAAARGDAAAEKPALDALSRRSVLVLLKQPPGPGAAEPRRNLVELKRERDGLPVVPVFTTRSRVTIPFPPPFQLVSTPMRAIVTTCGFRRYIVNPFSPEIAFEIDEATWLRLKACIEEQGYEPDAPSRDSPWAFQLPPDSLYPVGFALASWFTQHGRINEAYMYEVFRPRSPAGPRGQIVLGLNEPLDLDLAKTLTEVAVQAGAPSGSFVVRFLPEEPTHQNGVAAIQLKPFWTRPG